MSSTYAEVASTHPSKNSKSDQTDPSDLKQQQDYTDPAISFLRNRGDRVSLLNGRNPNLSQLDRDNGVFPLRLHFTSPEPIKEDLLAIFSNYSKIERISKKNNTIFFAPSPQNLKGFLNDFHNKKILSNMRFSFYSDYYDIVTTLIPRAYTENEVDITSQIFTESHKEQPPVFFNLSTVNGKSYAFELLDTTPAQRAIPRKPIIISKYINYFAMLRTATKSARPEANSSTSDSETEDSSSNGDNSSDDEPSENTLSSSTQPKQNSLLGSIRGSIPTRIFSFWNTFKFFREMVLMLINTLGINVLYLTAHIFCLSVLLGVGYLTI
ncbi:hypothetical protein ACTFIV_006172 [Dictyostelium citrinum]